MLDYNYILHLAEPHDGHGLTSLIKVCTKHNERQEVFECVRSTTLAVYTEQHDCHGVRYCR